MDLLPRRGPSPLRRAIGSLLGQSRQQGGGDMVEALQGQVPVTGMYLWTSFDGSRHGEEYSVERDIASRYIPPSGTPGLGRVTRTLSRAGYPSGDGSFDRAPLLSLDRPTHLLSSRVTGQEQEPLHRTYAPSERIPFEFVKHLGDGGEGSVDAVELYSNGQRQVYARKTFKFREDDSRNKDRILNEVKIIRRLRHVHIVSVVSSYEQQPSNSYIHLFGIIMEPVADCDLGKLLKAIDNSQMPEPCLNLIKSRLRGWCVCLINALAYMHDRGVRHKDIKPDNILVRGDRIYITDFGLAKDVVGLETTEKEGHTTKTPVTSPRGSN
jgi:serine/threonine protein kinase